MVATCGGSLLYILPLILGRTYDSATHKVGVDIFSPEAIDEAEKHPKVNPNMMSKYITIDRTSEKRSFLGISGELALNIKAGLVDVRGSGEYLKDTSNVDNSIEILIKKTFNSMIVEIDPDTQPADWWMSRTKESVGTDVVTSLVYGGEIYASVKFVLLKSEFKESVKAQVRASISKSGSFDVDVQGKLDMLAQNISSKAKLEIDYFATVPLGGVPTTIKELNDLVAEFDTQIHSVNGGSGVIICAGLTPLSTYSDKFKFITNEELTDALDDFSNRFDDLRNAKAMLKDLITPLPVTVSDKYMGKVRNFADRLTKTLRKFHEVIGNLNLQDGPDQLTPADDAYNDNSEFDSTDVRYSGEVRAIGTERDETDDPLQPRGIYVHWGKRTCGIKASRLLYIGFMSSFIERGIGFGTSYQCLPENPDLKTDVPNKNINGLQNPLTASRYRSLSVFKGSGRLVEGQVASCAVCETPLRPTVRVFPAVGLCPPDWVQEYNGYLVSTPRGRLRAQTVCLNVDPDSFGNSTDVRQDDPLVAPVILAKDGLDGSNFTVDASVQCVVCSR